MTFIKDHTEDSINCGNMRRQREIHWLTAKAALKSMVAVDYAFSLGVKYVHDRKEAFQISEELDDLVERFISAYETWTFEKWGE